MAKKKGDTGQQLLLSSDESEESRELKKAVEAIHISTRIGLLQKR